ncbi:MAG: CNNM domain-containing protein [Candidatus Saccharimonadales bacterium]
MNTFTLIIEVLILVGFSAVCSGLNIALMSLDISDLRRKAKLGNISAKLVLPLRRNSHLSLAAILLTNVGAVSATSLVLEHHVGGLIAGLLSTLLVVIFGEIFPQALFSRRALFYVSLLAPALRIMIFFTYPVSKPLQLLLDKLFSKEQSQLQSRHELGIMITEHLGHQESELDEDEVEIIRGALQLSEKRVRDIMLPIGKVFWLTPDSKLSPNKIDEIKRVGRSRIPVFNRRLTQCYGVLLMKELVDIDFDEVEYRVDDLPLHPTQMVGSMTALDTMFRKFIGAKSHLIPVEKDDEIVGIVTIEDLIEEIVGHEIEDETDHANKIRKV